MKTPSNLKPLKPTTAQQIDEAVRGLRRALIAKGALMAKGTRSEIAAAEAAIATAEVNLSTTIRQNSETVTGLEQAELASAKSAKPIKSFDTIGEKVVARARKSVTPFELVSIAATLARNTNSVEASKVEDYFPAAKQALERAKAYLSELESGSTEAFLQVLGVRSYTFQEVIKELPAQSTGQKRKKTMVGGIASRAGLVKAIKRVFHDWQPILDSGVLLSSQIDEIRRDHDRRMHTRTQAATAARKNRGKKNLKKS